ncbi:hypothetical protein NPIL_215931 [Nephila pilipes]|uniref:Uncharacterized protein n=1 Tax=Nephila pilipes TaxID=299642 RepID=A0A8X6NEB0_NEPPI|nr:hypothetical protein NPIL_215931 [Nephila pilipes]
MPLISRCMSKGIQVGNSIITGQKVESVRGTVRQIHTQRMEWSGVEFGGNVYEELKLFARLFCVLHFLSLTPVGEKTKFFEKTRSNRLKVPVRKQKYFQCPRIEPESMTSTSSRQKRLTFKEKADERIDSTCCHSYSGQSFEKFPLS